MKNISALQQLAETLNKNGLDNRFLYLLTNNKIKTIEDLNSFLHKYELSKYKLPITLNTKKEQIFEQLTSHINNLKKEQFIKENEIFIYYTIEDLMAASHEKYTKQQIREKVISRKHHVDHTQIMEILNDIIENCINP